MSAGPAIRTSTSRSARRAASRAARSGSARSRCATTPPAAPTPSRPATARRRVEGAEAPRGCRPGRGRGSGSGSRPGQKVGEGFFPRGVDVSPRSYPRNGSKPEEGSFPLVSAQVARRSVRRRPWDRPNNGRGRPSPSSRRRATPVHARAADSSQNTRKNVAERTLPPLLDVSPRSYSRKRTQPEERTLPHFLRRPKPVRTRAPEPPSAHPNP